MNAAGGPDAGQLTYYDILREVHQAHPRFDLATGQPLHDVDVTRTVGSALAAAAATGGIASRLATFADLDGSPALRSAFAAMLSKSLGRTVADGELLVVPGAQAALRYVQAVMRDSERRLLYPVGLEYPGAFDQRAARRPSVGQPRWSADAMVIELQPDQLDWDGVGAVVLSQPHSPTGRVWPIEDLRRLSDDGARRGAWLVLDETFALPAIPLQVEPVRLLDRPNVVHLFSFAKLGLGAERLSVIAAHPDIIAPLRLQLREHAIAASYLGQVLATSLLEAAATTGVGSRLAHLYQHCWQALCGALAPALQDTNVRVAKWQGGPFLWLSWPPDGPDGTAVFRALLGRGVGVAPGVALHATGEPVRGVRVGLGASAAALAEAGGLVQATLRCMLAGGT